jgi:hypothetical protein
MNVFKVLTAKNEIMLKETIDDANAGNLENKNKVKEEKKMREEHSKYFQSEEYWEILKLSIALNIDGTIKHLDTPNINGDTEICETKNKTDNAFIDFLYRFKSPISVEKKTYLNEKDSYHQLSLHRCPHDPCVLRPVAAGHSAEGRRRLRKLLQDGRRCRVGACLRLCQCRQDVRQAHQQHPVLQHFLQRRR